jgi:DegV family protein with EDD domain
VGPNVRLEGCVVGRSCDLRQGAHLEEGVVLGDEVRRDHELSPADILDGAARGPVTTSAPSPGDYLGALGELRDRHVVVLTVARGMSASYESAKIAAGYLEKRRAAVVDTQTAAGGQGLVVMAAARAARAGAGLDDVAAAAQRVIRRVHLLASLDRLDHLATSGRVPKVVTLAGRSVGMRAIFEFSFGRARVRMPARNADSAVARIVAACGADDPGGARLHAAVLDAEAPAAAEALMDAVQHLAPRGEIYAAPFSSVMVAHTGPGLAGLAWWWEPREELVPTGQHVAGGETG